MPVREGLARLEGVESISERCDRRSGTGELRMRDGRLVDPKVLAEQILNIGVGARLRGLEARVSGNLKKREGELFLDLGGKTNQLLRLRPLTRKIQIVDGDQKKLATPTEAEVAAYSKLLASKHTSVRVSGTVTNDEKGQVLLEVREFSVQPVRSPKG